MAFKYCPLKPAENYYSP